MQKETTLLNISSMINEDLILINEKSDTPKDLFMNVAEILEKKNIVKKSFCKAILSRENKFPTGINTEPINVAIPHADPEHVNKAALVIVKTQNPIPFNQMDNKDNKVNVEIVFFLIIDKKEKQSKFLSKLIIAIQNSDFLKFIKTNEDPKEIKKLVIKELS
jgi:PTS system galactitol-specific IIA component